MVVIGRRNRLVGRFNSKLTRNEQTRLDVMCLAEASFLINCYVEMHLTSENEEKIK